VPVENALKTISAVDLAAERAEIGPAVEESVLRVLRSGQFVLGPEVERFERAFASLCGAADGIGVANGTDALILGLKSIGVKPGDRVVTSPFTFFASAATIDWIHAKPILADVDPETALLDPARAESAVDRETTCILPVHLYGQMADMRAFRGIADRRKLLLLEDAAQSHGATRGGEPVSALSDAAAFSFYPTKNLGACGEGGMIVTRNPEIAQRARRLRDHGSARKYEHAEIGTNSRLQGIQAAVLNAKLPRLEIWNERRRAIARAYDEAFAECAEVRPLRTAPDAVHVRHQYTVRIRGAVPRDAVLERLKSAGILAAIHYATPVHLQPAARAWGYRPGDFPAAERLAREVLCLPVHPFLADSEVLRVAEATVAAARG